MKFEYILSTNSYIPIPQNYKDCIELLQSDYFRMRNKLASVFEIYLHSFVEPTLRFLFWHRLSQVRGWLWPLAKWRHRHYMFKYGLMIPSSTKIGYGFYIGHPCGITINHTAVIGNNVNLSQFTSVGANEGLAAEIGDNVYIGPSCCLIENVKIGANSTIGAGAIVTHDIPENSVAVGNPARIIHSSLLPSKYIGNRWKFVIKENDN